MIRKHTHSNHTVYHHRYHLIWITKYRYKVLSTPLKKRVREIVAQVAEEMNIYIENGVVSSDHVHVFVSIPPHICVSDFVQKAKGRSSRKIQMEFHHILKEKYWGKHLWARGYFSNTSGNVTDDVINEYIDNHEDGSAPTGADNIRME